MSSPSNQSPTVPSANVPAVVFGQGEAANASSIKPRTRDGRQVYQGQGIQLVVEMAPKANNRRLTLELKMAVHGF